MADNRTFIVHVLHHLVIGGMENGVVNLINNLPHDGFRHAVICIEDFLPAFRQRIMRPDVEVFALHRSTISVYQLRWQLFKLFRRLRPDVVHSRNLSGLDALLPARLAGCHTVHSEHGFDVSDLQGAARKPALLRRLHAPLVQRYITVSRDLQQLMVERWGIAPGKITQIYNGVDTQRFTPVYPRDRAPLPASMQLDPLFVVGAVGRLQAVKDQATLLRAFALTLQHQPEWSTWLRLAVVGDGPLREQLQAQATELGIAGLTWFAGARHDLPELLRSFDLFVLPSLNEGISNTFLEAMASGLPVLATAVGGNVELQDEGVTGASINPGDVARLADLITAYAGNPALTQQHGMAARQRAVEHFSLSAMLANYQQVYQALADK